MALWLVVMPFTVLNYDLEFNEPKLPFGVQHECFYKFITKNIAKDFETEADTDAE